MVGAARVTALNVLARKFGTAHKAAGSSVAEQPDKGQIAGSIPARRILHHIEGGASLRDG